jgi:hypothetical protein
VASGAWGHGEAWRPVTSAALGLAVQVPAGLVEQESDGGEFVLIRPATGPLDFEAIQRARRKHRGGETAAGRHAELSRLVVAGGWHGVLLAPLQSYPIGGHDGTLAIIRFTDGAGVVTGATLWCGQVGDETVTLLYRCGLAREAVLAATVGAILASLTIAERRRVRTAPSRAQPRAANPRLVFAVNLLIAIALVLVGLALRAMG